MIDDFWQGGESYQSDRLPLRRRLVTCCATRRYEVRVSLALRAKRRHNDEHSLSVERRGGRCSNGDGIGDLRGAAGRLEVQASSDPERMGERVNGRALLGWLYFGVVCALAVAATILLVATSRGGG